MKFFTLACISAVAAQITDSHHEDCPDIRDNFDELWGAYADLQDWLICEGHDDEDYLAEISISLDDIGNSNDEYGYAEYTVQRTEPFGSTSYIQIYYDSFLSDAYQLDYECVTGCEYNELVYIGRTDKSDQTGNGFYNGYLVLALSSDFNREE